jgi:hypothetical protein
MSKESGHMDATHTTHSDRFVFWVVLFLSKLIHKTECLSAEADRIPSINHVTDRSCFSRTVSFITEILCETQHSGNKLQHRKTTTHLLLVLSKKCLGQMLQILTYAKNTDLLHCSRSKK